MPSNSRNGRPIRLHVVGDRDSIDRLETDLKRYHSIKRREGNSLYLQVPNKHQNFINTLKRKVSGLKVEEILEFPSEEGRLGDGGGEEESHTVRSFSRRQRTLKNKIADLEHALEVSEICGIPLGEIREYAKMSTKKEFLEFFGLSGEEFNQATIELTDALSREFDQEIILNISFTYEIDGERVPLYEFKRRNLERARAKR